MQASSKVALWSFVLGALFTYGVVYLFPGITGIGMFVTWALISGSAYAQLIKLTAAEATTDLKQTLADLQRENAKRESGADQVKIMPASAQSKETTEAPPVIVGARTIQKKESSFFLNLCKIFVILFFIFVVAGLFSNPNDRRSISKVPTSAAIQSSSSASELAKPSVAAQILEPTKFPVSAQTADPSIRSPLPSPSVSGKAQDLPVKMAPTATNIYGGRNEIDAVPVPQDASIQNNFPIPAVTEPPVAVPPQAPSALSEIQHPQNAPIDHTEEQKKQHDEVVKKEIEESSLMVSSCNAAQRAVKRALIAPSTAKFPSCGWSLEEHTFRISEDKKIISVNGYVDSQNTFGAMLRKKWVVVLERDNEDLFEHPRWAVIDLAVD